MSAFSGCYIGIGTPRHSIFICICNKNRAAHRSVDKNLDRRIGPFWYDWESWYVYSAQIGWHRGIKVTVFRNHRSFIPGEGIIPQIGGNDNFKYFQTTESYREEFTKFQSFRDELFLRAGSIVSGKAVALIYDRVLDRNIIYKRSYY